MTWGSVFSPPKEDPFAESQSLTATFGVPKVTRALLPLLSHTWTWGLGDDASVVGLTSFPVSSLRLICPEKNPSLLSADGRALDQEQPALCLDKKQAFPVFVVTAVPALWGQSSVLSPQSPVPSKRYLKMYQLFEKVVL